MKIKIIFIKFLTETLKDCNIVLLKMLRFLDKGYRKTEV